MGEVITYSTSLMTPEDLRAMAVYLQSLPSSKPVTVRQLLHQVLAGRRNLFDRARMSSSKAGSGNRAFSPARQQFDGAGRRTYRLIHAILVELTWG